MKYMTKTMIAVFLSVLIAGATAPAQGAESIKKEFSEYTEGIAKGVAPTAQEIVKQKASSPQRQRLIDTVLAEKDFFAVFLYHLDYYGIDRNSVLVSINREMITRGDTQLIGLLFLMPSGVLDTFLFERETTVLFMKKGYVVGKHDREAWASQGVTVADCETILKAHGITPRAVKITAPKENGKSAGQAQQKQPEQKKPVRSPARVVRKGK